MPNASGKKWARSSEALVEKFLTTMEDYEGIDRRKMFGYPCCFMNTHMFTGLHEENWILRLDDKDRNEMIRTYQTTLFEPMEGRPMREYVILPPAVLSNSDDLHDWIEKSMRFVSSLAPKKPKKKKARK